MGAGIAGGQHTENDAHRHAVEGGTDEVVVSQNEQAEHAHVHQEHFRTHLGRNGTDVLRGGQQCPVLLRLAAHGQCKHDAQSEQDAAEQIHRQPGRHLQGIRRGSRRQVNAQRLIQRGIEEKRGQAHRQCSGIQVETLMHLRGMCQPRGQEKADAEAHDQCHRQPRQVEAHRLGIGIAHQQIADERRNAGREQHGVDICAQLFLLHQAVKDNAQHRRPDVQERCGIAAHGKIVGRDFCRLAENLPQAGKHGIPVRHTHRRNEKRSGKEAEKQLQKRAFLQIF